MTTIIPPENLLPLRLIVTMMFVLVAMIPMSAIWLPESWRWSPEQGLEYGLKIFMWCVIGPIVVRTMIGLYK